MARTQGSLITVLEKKIGNMESQAIFRLWGDISERTSHQFERFVEILLANQINECLVIINSTGGNFFDAISMSENIALLQLNGITVRTCIRGIAASGAALVFFSGNPRGISTGSWILVHRPSFPIPTDGFALPSARKYVEDYSVVAVKVEKLVSEKTGIPIKKVSAAFKKETWISAERALSEGWCTVIAP